MSKFLFCVEKPSNEHNEKEWRFWREVSNRIEARIKTIEGVQKPCENVWLLPASKSMGALTDCIQTCREHGQKYKIAFLDADGLEFWE